MPLDWDDLRVLLAVEAAGSLSAAARALKVDPATVSRRLAALEDALGGRVLVRGDRGCFTELGRDALAAARAMDAEAARLLRRADAATGEVAGCVRLSTPPGLGPIWLRGLQPLRQRHPDLHVEVLSQNQQVDLARGEADVAVRMARPTQPDLVARHAFDLGWRLYASDAYVAERGLPRAVDDLSGHDVIAYGPAVGPATGPRWLDAHLAGARVVVRADGTQSALAALLDGSGITVLPSAFADGRPTLRRLFDDVVATSPGWIVFHEDLRGVARVRAVVDALHEVCAGLGRVGSLDG